MLIHSNLKILDSYPKMKQLTFSLKNSISSILERRIKPNAMRVCGAVIATATGKKFLLGGIYKLLGDFVGFIPPLGIAIVIQFTISASSRNNDKHYTTIEELLTNGYVMAIIVFVSALAQGSFSQASTHVLNVEGIRLKTALQALIYNKALKLNGWNKDDEVLHESKTGNTTNLISEDTYNVMSCYWIGHYIWAIPLKIGVLMYLLYCKLGISAIIGATCCIIILTPLQFLIGKNMSTNSKAISDWSDERLRQTNEVLQGIRLLKLSGGEMDFAQRILRTRIKELKLLDKDSLYWALMTFLTHAASALITLITLAAFYLLEEDSLKPADVFSGLALFNQLTVPLFIFPITVPIIISALISTKRLEEFLSLQETNSVLPENESGDSSLTFHHEEKKEYISDTESKRRSRSDSVFGLGNIAEQEEQDEDGEEVIDNQKEDHVVSIENAAFTWSDQIHPTLTITSLLIPRGKLSIVVGKIGSGKTSLLAAMLGEIHCIRGTVHWDKGCSIAFVSQKPWLLNGSLRDNILFGRPYRSRRYSRVISATALQPDIDILPGKDMTDIGERGINLSGGQRQRVTIARALYSKSNVVILDDPFSALDHQVAQHVFEEGIKKLVFKQKRTVILVTHSLQFLHHAHQIILLENGSVKACGGLYDVERGGIRSLKSENNSQETHKGRTARERWQLVKLVSRIGQQLKQRNLIDGTWKADHIAPSLFVPFRRRLGTFSGSRYFAHDLPLPTDECEEEELLERRTKSINCNSLIPVRHRAVLRATSLQARQSQPMYPVIRQSSSPSIHQGLRPRTYTFDVSSSQTGGGLLRQLFSMSSSRNVHQASSDLNVNFKDHGLLRRLISSTSIKSSVLSEPEKHTVQRLSSTTSDCSDDFLDDEETLDWGMSQVAQEEREYGKIQRRVYTIYLQACSVVLGLTYVMLAITWQGLRVYTDFWLSKWTDDSSKHSNSETLKYLSIYGALSIASILLSLLSNGLGQYCGAKARKCLHDLMLLGLLHCPIRFFETTPLGRIMNRFSTDLSVIDKKIATSIQRLLQFLLLCFSAILVNSIVTPWFLIVALPICLVYYMVQKFYRCSSRELQRLDSLSRTPILSHFSETLSGLETIRAFGQQKRFTNALFQKLNNHTNAFLIVNSCNRWLGIALDYLGGLIVFMAMIVSLVSASMFPSLVTPALVGLAINYTLLVPIYLNWVVKFLADMEMYMGAVERVSQYANATSEDYRKNGIKPPCWPQKGDIKFQGVSLRYDTSREPVITNLNLHIPAGQKVGICGRTGSGKSSLVMSLFNMVSVYEGNIYLDGVDIAVVPLQKLRSCLSIIPQDVIMFSGTIRENLDLRGEFTDFELWRSLELAQMKDTVASQLGGLDGVVREGGENLSAGQRQMLCLARAILLNTVCLVMDEATSSLDPNTETKLLNAASEAFSSRTVITIAHRLSGLLNCDRILVLESGKIVEDGPPAKLLRRSMGIFSTMLRAMEESS
uniref:Uncharacterized protein n=1 Tax=Clastoptera arizonana TaxID=38151 RepID=A0A1B6CN95_9HEMI